MDNQPQSDDQSNQPQQPSQGAPVFNSTELTKTKARKDAHYFTNVQKATLGQRIANWFNKVNRESVERSAARKASFKAKLAERRRAADLAALSVAVPESAPRATSSQPQSASTAAQPAPATPVATQATTTPPSATTPAPATTIIIDTPTPKPRRDKRPLIITLIILLILLIAATIALLIIRPWEPDSTIVSLTGQTIKLRGDPSGNIDMATSDSFEAITFRTNVINSTTLDVYTDSQSDDGTTSPYIIANNIDQVVKVNDITDPAVILIFDIEKARVFIIYEDYDSAWEILGQIDEASLYESQQKTFYAVMQLYYTNIGDTEKADEYATKYSALPVAEME